MISDSDILNGRILIVDDLAVNVRLSKRCCAELATRTLTPPWIRTRSAPCTSRTTTI